MKRPVTKRITSVQMGQKRRDFAHHSQVDTLAKGKKNEKKKTLHPVAIETHVLVQHPKEERMEKEEKEVVKLCKEEG
jgi:hypothetical protein